MQNASDDNPKMFIFGLPAVRPLFEGMIFPERYEQVFSRRTLEPRQR
jgi:hypothetical protein